MKYTTLEELAHSDGYYAATEPITGNELKHWKYIDRYKNSRGNWVYVYADKKTHNNIKKSANDRMIAKAENDTAQRYKSDMFDLPNGKKKTISPKEYDKTMASAFTAEGKLLLANYTYDRLLNANRSKTISSIQNVLSNVGSSVSNFYNSVKKKSSSFMKKLFNKD